MEGLPIEPRDRQRLDGVQRHVDARGPAADDGVGWFRRPGAPEVLLDGAHNPHGIAALAAALGELLPQVTASSPTLLMGVMANHWQEGMLDPLLDVAPKAALFATRVPDSTGSLEPVRLAAAWGAGAVAIADTERALGSALERASQASGPLIVCGSLYLVGYVRARLVAAATTE